MGNRGMTNWKLGAFFVMSLMLVADRSPRLGDGEDCSKR